MNDYQLHNLDCLEFMRTLQAGSVDAIITDLPYGTTACSWDAIIPMGQMWEQVKRILKDRGAFITTAKQPFTSVLVCSNLAWFKYEWVWNKVSKTDVFNGKNKPLNQHDNVLVFSSSTTANGSDRKMLYNPQGLKKGKRSSDQTKPIHRYVGKPRQSWDDFYTCQNSNYPSSILEFSNADHTEIYHPTQKPEPLYRYLVSTYTNEGDTVLDFCMGSGTTGVACMQLGRNFIGCDNDTEHGYFEIAEKRIKAAAMQEPLFV